MQDSERIAKSCIVAVSLGLLAAGCASNPVPAGTAYEGIRRELDQAAVARPATPPPAEVDAALLQPPAAAPPALAEPRFDLAVSDAPAAQVFMAIATGSRYSMLVHPELVGKISVNLKDVTVREALEALRDLYGYEYRIQGNRVLVLPNTLQTRVFQVNYLASRRSGQTDVRVTSGSITSSQGPSTAGASGAGIVPAALQSGGANATQRVVESSRVQTESQNDFWQELKIALGAIVGSEGGRGVIVNAVSGVVVVRGFPADQRNVEQYLRATQVMVERQVMLEAKLVEVRLKDGFQSGINWAYFNSDGNHRGSLGADTRNFSIPSGAPVSETSTVGATIGNTLGAGLESATGRAVGGIFGLALQTTNFAALIQFLETQGNVHVLSSPRIATLNNQKAVLKVGTDEFFVTNVTTTSTTSSTGTTISPTITTQPFFSGIALDVTPQIDDDNNVILHVHPSVSNVSEKNKIIDLGNLGTFQLPLASSDVNETDSIVRVRDGNIVAIGGLMTQRQIDGDSRIPVIGDIPGVGAFFGQKKTDYQKLEVVVLLKPTIIHGERAWTQGLEEVRGRIADFDPRPNPAIK
jgi:MSHA biogenesis protein MshL